MNGPFYIPHKASLREKKKKGFSLRFPIELEQVEFNSLSSRSHFDPNNMPSTPTTDAGVIATHATTEEHVAVPEWAGWAQGITFFLNGGSGISTFQVVEPSLSAAPQPSDRPKHLF
jgi:hypothetical protein